MKRNRKDASDIKKEEGGEVERKIREKGER